jgi:hypothetical protein
MSIAIRHSSIKGEARGSCPMRPSIRSSTIMAALALAACAARASDSKPGTDLERYAKLISLRGAGFSCLRATRPGGTPLPRDWRLHEATWHLQEEIRQVLIRREGKDRVLKVENPEGEDYDPLMTGAPCSVTASDRARQRYRDVLYEMRKRLGLPRTAARTGRD